MTESATPTLKDALEHARVWFTTHAAQRMQTFNFFLVATAFLVAGYAQVIEKRPLAAAVIALLGAWITCWFMMLERRTRQLVETGRVAMRPLERRLADGLGVPELEIVSAADNATAGCRYTTVFRAIHVAVVLVSLTGLLYASYLAFVGRPEKSPAATTTPGVPSSGTR
jgi:hypothetical protein